MFMAFNRERNDLGVSVLLMLGKWLPMPRKESVLADLFYKLKIGLG